MTPDLLMVPGPAPTTDRLTSSARPTPSETHDGDLFGQRLERAQRDLGERDRGERDRNEQIAAGSRRAENSADAAGRHRADQTGSASPSTEVETVTDDAPEVHTGSEVPADGGSTSDSSDHAGAVGVLAGASLVVEGGPQDPALDDDATVEVGTNPDGPSIAGDEETIAETERSDTSDAAAHAIGAHSGPEVGLADGAAPVVDDPVGGRDAARSGTVGVDSAASPGAAATTDLAGATDPGLSATDAGASAAKPSLGDATVDTVPPPDTGNSERTEGATTSAPTTVESTGETTSHDTIGTPSASAMGSSDSAAGSSDSATAPSDSAMAPSDSAMAPSDSAAGPSASATGSSASATGSLEPATGPSDAAIGPSASATGSSGSATASSAPVTALPGSTAPAADAVGEPIASAAPGSASTPSAGSPDIDGQLWGQLRSAMARARATVEGQELTMRLTPAELGELRIQVQSRGDQMVVRLTATSDDAQQRLFADQDRLARELADAGFEGASVDVRQENDRRGHSTDQDDPTVGRARFGAVTGPDSEHGGESPPRVPRRRSASTIEVML